MKRSEIVAHAREIAEGYYEQGLVLTVRQLYYQFVSRALLGSGQAVYKSIVAALSQARLDGDFPMHLIEDRGRDAQCGDFILCEDSTNRALRRCESTIHNLPDIFLRYDRWYGQNVFVSVWVEKEALAGIFEAPCQELGVGLFACRGYPSVSALYQWLRHLAKATDPEYRIGTDGDGREQRERGMATEAVILYFGDHDPDGWEIPRSAMRNMKILMQATNNDTGAPLIEFHNGIPNLDLRRIALNMDQIQQYNPPPFPAKETSTRFNGYFAEHNTMEAWELDALDPTVLRDLIVNSVNEFFDQDIYDQNEATITAHRHNLKKKMLVKDWFKTALQGDGK